MLRHWEECSNWSGLTGTPEIVIIIITLHVVLHAIISRYILVIVKELSEIINILVNVSPESHPAC